MRIDGDICFGFVKVVLCEVLSKDKSSSSSGCVEEHVGEALGGGTFALSHLNGEFNTNVLAYLAWLASK